VNEERVEVSVPKTTLMEMFARAKNLAMPCVIENTSNGSKKKKKKKMVAGPEKIKSHLTMEWMSGALERNTCGICVGLNET
jgi:hypothetical protein